jgi:gliding motility-associated-like protein
LSLYPNIHKKQSTKMTAFRGVKYALVTALAFISISLKAQLTANFSAIPTSGCAPLLVNFIDQSTGSPAQWKWDLGNGTISFLQSPSVTYFNPGQYTIKLVVYNANGDSSVIVKTQYITIYAQPAVAFTGSPLTGCYPLPVNFTDQSTAGSGTITQWRWDLGDGTLYNVQNPSHVYITSGNYNISLQVTNSFGCSKVLTKNQYIKVTTGAHADFSANNVSSCVAPFTVNFTNSSTGAAPLSYQWLFGDGATSAAANPVHTYTAAGSYNVRLVVTNGSGCTDTIVKTNYINIGAYNAAFTNNTTACVNTPVLFTNTSLPTPNGVSWNFGDATTSTAFNPVKTYSAPGVYTIRMIADFGGCFDTAYSSITIFNKPAAGFTAPVTTSCKPPLTVNFNNLSTGAASYVWNFGDGNTSTQRNPVHTYTATGLYTVTLIATSATGCSDTLVMPDFVQIENPKAVINNLPASFCAPLTHTFTSTVTSVDPVISYEWDFGDGTTSTLQNPTHTFAAGQYDIRLIITTAGGCTDTAFVPNGILASVKPVPNFIATPRNVCAFVPVNFTNLSTGTVTNWLWFFGDGTTSNAPNPSHEYQDTGYFDVTLVVCNAGCCDSIKFINYIHISPPIANFSTQLDCANRLFKQFNDQSIGADEWFWDFGDGSTSTLQNPAHMYADTGTYTVVLRVKNNTTGCEHTKTSVISIINEKANFTESAAVVCKYNQVNFSAIGNNAANVASYYWDFGDGYTSSGPNVVHSYLQSGNYNVTLIVTDVQGCNDTLIKNQGIRVNGPVAAFTPGTTGTCLLTAVTFTDNSSSDGINPIANWIWNYGDGVADTLTAPPFQHSYTSPGNYTVTLKVTDTLGCYDTSILSTPIFISKPASNFITADTISCPTKNIVFTNLSSGPGLNYSWNFGDGNTANIPNPVHVYTSDGLYTIKLIVTDQYGCSDTMIKPDYIRIVSPHSIYTISDTLSTCPPLVVTFTNASQNFTSLVWDFGDGSSTVSSNPTHFYTSAGTYITKLTVTSPGGCVDVSQKTIVVRGPQGVFTYNPINGCKPLTVNFNATTKDRLSFIWDYNDGSTSVTTDSVVSHTYTIPGIYLPKMILVDSNGCVVPITGPDTIVVSGAAANFGFLNNTYCDDAIVAFSDSSRSNDVIISYAWNFGDGGTSSVQNPTHHYTSTGLYYPKLVVTTQNGCVDSAQLPAPVKIASSPVADITNERNGCVSLAVNFRAQLLNPDSSAIAWQWNLGNGNTSYVQFPPQQLYTNAGIYNVSLIATNSSGCKDTVTTTVEAYAIPSINAGVDTLVCRGRSTRLVASGGSTYLWSPSKGLSCTTCAQPSASPDSLTTYVVRGTTAVGCSSNDTVIVDVKQRFTMLNSPGDTICRGGSVRLFANGANSYVWSPSTGLSSSSSSNPLATPATTTTYRVIGTDNRACFTDTGFATVHVYPIPTIEAGQDKTINVGQSVTLTPTVSADVSKVIWSPIQTIINSNGNSITVKPKETTTYTAEVRNDGGCKARDNVTVYVICNGANIFIPNTFTPNGDGVNDIFYPRGTGLFRIKTLRIFSRWGEVMYEKNDFFPNDAGAGWNGTFKGKTLTPDVYVYTIDIICDNSSILTLKGNVALLQ